MSPDEIKAVSEIAAGRWDYIPWVILIGTFLVSTIGAFIGSYLQKKGKNHATKEDFNELLLQVRRTTHATEQIKTTLSSRAWLSQQQWVIREQHYENLLKHLTLVKNALEDQESYYLRPGSERDDSIPDRPAFQELSRVTHESYQILRSLIGPASIFLSTAAVHALESMVHSHWAVGENSSCTAEYVSEFLKLTNAAHSAVLTEARNELAQAQLG
jgi:hypothetical protein